MPTATDASRVAISHQIWRGLQSLDLKVDVWSLEFQTLYILNPSHMTQHSETMEVYLAQHQAPVPAHLGLTTYSPLPRGMEGNWHGD